MSFFLNCGMALLFELWRSRARLTEALDTTLRSVLDNGVTSLEYWRIVDAAEDLSWAVFFYSGAAEAAGQGYSGSLLVTADGKWPPLSELPRIQEAHEKMGIAIWELSVGYACTVCSHLEPSPVMLCSRLVAREAAPAAAQHD